MAARMIESEYWFGSVVHHKMADECEPGIVTGLTFSEAENKAVTILYRISWRGRTESWHHATELQGERPSIVTEP